MRCILCKTMEKHHIVTSGAINNFCVLKDECAEKNKISLKEIKAVH